MYGGVLQAVREELANELRLELGEDHAAVHKEESALFAFVVDDLSRLIDGTGAFSSCAWGPGASGAAAMRSSPGPAWCVPRPCYAGSPRPRVTSPRGTSWRYRCAPDAPTRRSSAHCPRRKFLSEPQP